MHLHILGISGTFMGSLALLAKALGHRVTGSDLNNYPPISTMLENAGVEVMQGYDRSHLQPHPDLVVVGNAMKRGIDAIEYMLDQGLAYTSGPQFLADHVLVGRHVLAVAGTHGKTSTSTMLAWVLDHAGLNPGFLIGGVPLGFSQSARLGDGKYFVVEADEYDSAFFDKRSKFIHYQPRTTIINNLEFDHADIFDDLAAIQKQFHHLIRTIPSQGLIIAPKNESHIDQTLEMGVWTPVVRTSIGFGADIYAKLISADGGHFTVHKADAVCGEVIWSLSGEHNVLNALATIAAAEHIGVSIDASCQALSCFSGVKRRMELLATINDVMVFDDFAHHPTAIKTTLEGARKKFAQKKIWAIIEPRSNTMRLGSHKAALASSTQDADEVIWYQPKGLDWDLTDVLDQAEVKSSIHDDIDTIVENVASQLKSGDVVIIMSNGSFDGIHQRLITRLS